MWRLFRKKKRARTRVVGAKHYLENKAAARELTLARLAHFNQHYNFTWKRVAIRNQRRCWGSCSSLKNLNFNYKILFLPPPLRDYIIVHELCHLAELNHGQSFWDLVEQTIPGYKKLVLELKAIDRGGNSIAHLNAVLANYKLEPSPVLESELSESLASISY